MDLEQALDLTASYAGPESFDKFRDHLDPRWIDEALDATGTWTLRRRRLPADQVVWLVIAMGLFRDRPIQELVEELELSVGGDGPVAPSAVSDARGRLGREPMEWLVERSGKQWAHDSARGRAWRGLAVYGVDGSTLRAPDTQLNRDYFGGTQTTRGASGYPLVRVVALMALRSHLLVAARQGAYSKSENAYATELWPLVPDDSITVVDRLFLAANVLIPLACQGRNRHWLTRAKSNTRWQEVKKLGRGDVLVEMEVSAAARKADPSLPKTWTLRAIRYQRKGFRPGTLLTSLVDSERYLASEITALYHERWELELGFDEIKTEMLDREETLRSQTPARVLQEVWGVLLAYNLIRLEMQRVADEAGVPPTRISFVAALHLIRNEWNWLAVTKPGAIPQRLQKLRARLRRLVLPQRRSERAYPRAVKIKMSKWPRKRPTTTTTAKSR